MRLFPKCACLGPSGGCLCNIWVFFLTLPPGRGAVARSPGNFLVHVSGHGTRGRLPRGLLSSGSRSCLPSGGQLIGRSSGRSSALAVMGGPEEPRVLSLCEEQRGLPWLRWPSRELDGQAHGLAPSQLALGGLFTSGIPVSSSGDGHGPGTAEQGKREAEY